MAEEYKTVPITIAHCETCDKEWGGTQGRNAHAVGAKHARHHKHHVWVEVTRTYVYDHTN